MAMTKEEKAERRAARAAEKEIIRLQDCHAASKRRVARQNIPEPTVLYEVGERVKFGAWDWTAILKVYEDGKYYKAISVTRKTNRNVPDATEGKIHHFAWFDIVPYRAIINQPVLTQDDDIHFNYQQRDVRSLLYMYFTDHGIDLNPEYQRGNVWTAEQKEALIESVFNNVDIGKFAIIKRPWGPDGNKPLTPLLYEMLDGKQRLTALVEFFTGHFAYKGIYYNDLHPGDQSHFRNYSVSYAETSPLTKEQKYRYFLKLNTTGTPVDPKHMEKVAGMLKEEIDKNGN